MAFLMMKLANKNVFISPLDWGLGHTTRCIPIIKSLQELGAKVWIGVKEEQKRMLEQEVKNVSYVDFEGYNISYPSDKSMAFKMAIQVPKILLQIKKENNKLKLLIQKYQFDLIISDNRFGLYSNKIPSIYITHQINIQAPLGIDKVLYRLHEQYINNYAQCWIPDYESLEKSLAGNLSHRNIKENYFYINQLSRFNSPCLSSNAEYEFLAIISGPEPQRSIFEGKIADFFKSINAKCAILSGKPLVRSKKTNSNIDYYSHLNSEAFYELVNLSKKIICRPGYSSIMDLSVLQKPVLFIPTPGQTEQEYLAKFYKYNYKISYVKQENINAIKDSIFNSLPFSNNANLTDKIRELVELINE